MTAVFNTNSDGSLFGGGFRFDSLSSLPSVVIKGGSSNGSSTQFSDMYESYAVPFGLWSSNSLKSYAFRGGSSSTNEDEDEDKDKDEDENKNNSETKESDSVEEKKVSTKKDVLAQDLHEKLLELVREKRIKKGQSKKREIKDSKMKDSKKPSKKNKTKKNYDD
jgi:hypothetical protein